MFVGVDRSEDNIGLIGWKIAVVGLVVDGFWWSIAGTGGGLEKILRVNISSPSDVTSKCTSLKEICLRVHQSGPFLEAKFKVKNNFITLF